MQIQVLTPEEYEAYSEDCEFSAVVYMDLSDRPEWEWTHALALTGTYDEVYAYSETLMDEFGNIVQKFRNYDGPKHPPSKSELLPPKTPDA